MRTNIIRLLFYTHKVLKSWSAEGGCQKVEGGSVCGQGGAIKSFSDFRHRVAGQVR